MNRYLFLFAMLLMHQSKTNAQTTLYSSEAFTLFSDKIIQGKNTAVAVSPSKIISSYKSPASTTFSRLIKYKFSINEKENEMAPGDDHWVLIGEEHEAPVVTFGKIPSPQPKTSAGYLPVNYEYTFRVDMNPVLKQFQEKGYYEAYDGSRIAKSDFKGFYIAGGADPLSWDFVNLGNKGLKLEDEDGDGIYSIKIIFNRYDEGVAQEEKTWSLTRDISHKPSYSSSQPIVDALFNLSLEEALINIEADSTFRTGAKWGGVWTRDISYSILLAFAYHQPDIAKISLLKKVKRRRIIQDTGSGGSWPVSSDRTTWVLAAWELYKVTGDRSWLEEAFEIISNTLEDDNKVLADPVTGLYKGESSFLDWREQTYPRWMNNADIYMSKNLGTNVVHYQANRIAGWMAKELGKSSDVYEMRAESIKKGINKYLWNKEKGYYGQYLYGRAGLSLSPRFEALGESLAVLFDVADSYKASSIFQKSPLTPYGVTCIYPQIPDIPPYHNNAIWPFVQSYWNLAAAKAGNEAVLSHGLASIYRAAGFFLTNYENMVAETGDFNGTEVNSDRMLWSMAGNLAMVHRVFIGMQFETNGIRFSPAIPSAYTGTKTLRNFKYRNAVLTIKILGTGNKIMSFKVNGVEQTDPFIPSNITGENEIEIQLNNRPFNTGNLRLSENLFSLPEPQVTREKNRLKWKPVKGAEFYRIIKDGKEIASTNKNFYKVKISSPSEYQVLALDKNWISSFASEPLLVAKESDIQSIEVENSAEKTNLSYINYSGNGFVELSTTQNTKLEIPVMVSEAGNYRIDFRYSNGSGPWNTDNKCAIRSLYHNNILAGTIVFPQRGTDEWSNWGYSNSVVLPLKKGENRIQLILEPWNTNMNVEINKAMLDAVRVVRL